MNYWIQNSINLWGYLKLKTRNDLYHLHRYQALAYMHPQVSKILFISCDFRSPICPVFSPSVCESVCESVRPSVRYAKRPKKARLRKKVRFRKCFDFVFNFFFLSFFFKCHNRTWSQLCHVLTCFFLSQQNMSQQNMVAAFSCTYMLVAVKVTKLGRVKIQTIYVN